MTAQELAPLAVGLLLGVIAGAALVIGLRRQPRPTRGVRVTVTRNAIPRRSATLSDGAFRNRGDSARGGPADHAPRDGEAAAPDDSGTPVRATTPRSITTAGADEPASRLVAVPMGRGVDPMLGALRPAPAVPGGEPDPASAVMASVGGPAGTTAAQEDAGRATASVGRAEPLTGPAATGDRAPAAEPAPSVEYSGPCAEPRRVSDERCEVAARARAEAERAHDTVRAAQRSYDEELARAEEAARSSDPRSVRAAKDLAQQTFRIARANAATSEALDVAARDWLLEINRINAETRTATTTVHQAQEKARQLAGSLERLSVEADAARIAAEAAEEACLAARQALADCEEAAAPEPVDATQPAVPSGAPGGPWADDSFIAPNETPGALVTGTTPTIFRLLQGDTGVLNDVVARLAGDEPADRSRWQLAISDLVDAILATAIEGSALEFPVEHAFWGTFTQEQSRDIVAALASLGYRFDGLGGWQDGRIPSQRDLSLALGYAGLDPMRMRHWPNEAEMFELLSGVRVAAPEYLAGAAGDLTLGELVTMLGRRAEGLAEIWNAWGRIRPLLLEER